MRGLKLIENAAVTQGDPPPVVLARLGIGLTPVLRSRSFRRGQLSVMRLKSVSDPDGQLVPLPAEDAWAIHLPLCASSGRRLRVDGRPVSAAPYKAGSLDLYDLRRDLAVGLDDPLDVMRLHLPRGALDELADDVGAPRVTSLSFQHGVGLDDIVARSLATSLLPALERPNETDGLFVDHVALALRVHIARAYGGMETEPRTLRGGLAAWQERRAKEALEANLDKDIALVDIAQACGLSVSYFARAFRQCTGQPPHRWLTQRRVARAKELLSGSSMPLAEIALACGFADQSHFGRVFMQTERTSPGAWRRRRSAPQPLDSLEQLEAA